MLRVLRNYEKSLPLISFSVEGTHSFLLIKRPHILILIYIDSKLFSDHDFEKYLSSSIELQDYFLY